MDSSLPPLTGEKLFSAFRSGRHSRTRNPNENHGCPLNLRHSYNYCFLFSFRVLPLWKFKYYLKMSPALMLMADCCLLIITSQARFENIPTLAQLISPTKVVLLKCKGRTNQSMDPIRKDPQLKLIASSSTPFFSGRGINVRI